MTSKDIMTMMSMRTVKEMRILKMMLMSTLKDMRMVNWLGNAAPTASCNDIDGHDYDIGKGST